MTSDEAEAAAWLEKRFWKNVFSSQYEFLWRPRRDPVTGRLMWLCQAVKVESGYVEHDTRAIDLNLTLDEAFSLLTNDIKTTFGIS